MHKLDKRPSRMFTHKNGKPHQPTDSGELKDSDKKKEILISCENILPKSGVSETLSEKKKCE